VKTRRFRVIGEEGTLLADLLAPRLLHMRDEVQELALDTAEPLASQFDGFCDLLEGRPDAAIVSLSDGLAAVATADAALRSAREGRPITL